MKVIHIDGNLTADPVFQQDGRTQCHFTVAVNSLTNKRMPDGKFQKVKTVDFFRITVFNPNDAENCAKYLKKGRKVSLYGPLSISTARDSKGEIIYKKDADGNPTDEQAINLEIIAQGIEFQSNGTAAQPAAAGEQTAEQPASDIPKGATQVDMPDDELPF